MRHFKFYSPTHIAKHVRAFFSGVFTIQDIGTFRFEFGRVVVEKSQALALKQIAREINAQLLAQRQ